MIVVDEDNFSDDAMCDTHCSLNFITAGIGDAAAATTEEVPPASECNLLRLVLFLLLL